MTETLQLASFSAERLNFRSGPSYFIYGKLARSAATGALDPTRFIRLELIGDRMTLHGRLQRLKNVEYEMVRLALESRLGALAYLTETLGHDLAAAGFTLCNLTTYLSSETFKQRQPPCRLFRLASCMSIRATPTSTWSSNHSLQRRTGRRLWASVDSRGSFDLDRRWADAGLVGVPESAARLLPRSSIEKLLRDAHARINDILPDSIEING